MSKPKAKSKPKIVNRRLAGRDHAVVTVVGGGSGYRKSPCAECPWRLDQVGTFPAEAFRHSAPTAYDAAMETFACHMKGSDKPTICAGFLLQNAEHNIGVRIQAALGKLDPSAISSGGVDLHNSYRAMAIANGVDPKDPVLAPCRANGYGADNGAVD